MTRISNRLIPNVIIFSIFMCFLGKTASAQMENYDETYYSPAKNEVVVEKYDPIVLYKDTTVRSVEQEQILELEGVPMNAETKAKTKTIVVYDESDYYDYAYTARIRRFDNPVIGIGYYDDYYTNMYWYTYNPNYWGVSIYLGYNWWYPSWSWYYRPYYYSYWGYYDPFFNPYWNPYWDPFYYGHHHHHHHHHYYGHHHGHHHHYAWNCNHYYNSLDRGSFYYGPRTYNGATTRYLGGRTENIAYRNSTARYSNRDNRSFGQRYESAMASRTNTSRGNAAGLNTTTRRGGVDINRNAYRSSVTNRTSSSGATGRVTTTNNNDRTSTTGRVTTGTNNRTTTTGTTTTGRVTTGTSNRTTTTGTTRQVSGSDKYSKPSSVENARTEQYTRPTNRTSSTNSGRVSGSSNSSSNNRSSYNGGSNSKTRSSNTTGTIQRRSSNNSGSINRSSSTNSRSSSVRSSGSSSRSSSYGSSSSRSSSSSSRSSSSGSSRSSRR